MFPDLVAEIPKFGAISPTPKGIRQDSFCEMPLVESGEHDP
jgi:hypothetical protein